MRLIFIMEKMQNSHYRCSWWWTQKTAKQSNKKRKRKETLGVLLRVEKNSKVEEQFEDPQHLTHSKRVFWQSACNWTSVLSSASKERWFLSNQTTHIKQSGTIFHMSKVDFPNQLLQQDTKLATEPGMTHWIPKACNICTHKE